MNICESTPFEEFPGFENILGNKEKVLAEKKERLRLQQRECQKRYDAKNREKVLQMKRDYVKKNREWLNEYARVRSKKLYAQDPEPFKKYQLDYYHANAELLRPRKVISSQKARDKKKLEKEQAKAQTNIKLSFD